MITWHDTQSRARKLALGAAGIYLTSPGNATGFGWYAYAPLSQPVSPPRTGLAGCLRLIIWLAIGMVIYFTYSVKHSRLQRGELVVPDEPPQPTYVD